LGRRVVDRRALREGDYSQVNSWAFIDDCAARRSAHGATDAPFESGDPSRVRIEFGKRIQKLPRARFGFLGQSDCVWRCECVLAEIIGCGNVFGHLRLPFAISLKVDSLG
jgi:hypothetical protein